MKMKNMGELLDDFEKKLEDAKRMGESYIMVFKPFCRRVIINPILIREGTNIYAMNPEGSFCVNLLSFDEISVGVTDRDFYNKYDHNNIIIK